mmetsp:Transcript_38573/g.92160  ORF Transcript_38573/g.92160 Transcript_38573/m.92160 type:complete len:363 (+) Transcript_38573:371-1459(+)
MHEHPVKCSFATLRQAPHQQALVAFFAQQSCLPLQREGKPHAHILQAQRVCLQILGSIVVEPADALSSAVGRDGDVWRQRQHNPHARHSKGALALQVSHIACPKWVQVDQGCLVLPVRGQNDALGQLQSSRWRPWHRSRCRRCRRIDPGQGCGKGLRLLPLLVGLGVGLGHGIGFFDLLGELLDQLHQLVPWRDGGAASVRRVVADHPQEVGHAHHAGQLRAALPEPVDLVFQRGLRAQLGALLREPRVVLQLLGHPCLQPRPRRDHQLPVPLVPDLRQTHLAPQLIHHLRQRWPRHDHTAFVRLLKDCSLIPVPIQADLHHIDGTSTEPLHNVPIALILPALIASKEDALPPAAAIIPSSG